uniref:BZIP domain-containing protein n=1 Tax=Erpetoichthys calabaricus TaxID=27687 RepID=A0A8C4X6L6_ERPCA
MSKNIMSDLEIQMTSGSIISTNAVSDACIDQDGEWDYSLFDDIGDLGDTTELLQALEYEQYSKNEDGLDFDIDLLSWSSSAYDETASNYTDVDVTDILSPDSSACSVPSPSSVSSLSPYFVPEDLDISHTAQLSPVSLYSDTDSTCEVKASDKLQKSAKILSGKVSTNPPTRPIHFMPKINIKPKPVIAAVPLSHTTVQLPAKTIILQPLQTVLPLSKQQHVPIQPAFHTGQSVMLGQPTQVVQLTTPQIVTAQPVVTVPDPAIKHPEDNITSPKKMTFSKPVVQPSRTATVSDGDTNVLRRQQRMIKNRESASLSRKKKKEYLLTLEARLKLALSENVKLMNENGLLKKQLEGLLSENQNLKLTAPKRRTVCVMVFLAFLVLHISPLSIFEQNPGTKLSGGSVHHSRHLLEFSNVEGSKRGQEPTDFVIPPNKERVHIPNSDKKALMVVKKDPLLYISPPPCQPVINKTKSIRLAHELRGWVHRHEVERTKSRRVTNSQPRKHSGEHSEDKKAEVSPFLTVQYTDTAEKVSGSELQLYYATHRNYHDFFEEINRRGDTFYVVSFRRDHLLLPATSLNKGSRPKMSLVLPAIHLNESVIKNEDYEIMMQIDCEVMDTRILHIRTSSIPPFLRDSQGNGTNTFYHSSTTNSQTSAPVGAIAEAVK